MAVLWYSDNISKCTTFTTVYIHKCSHVDIGCNIVLFLSRPTVENSVNTIIYQYGNH